MSAAVCVDSDSAVVSYRPAAGEIRPVCARDDSESAVVYLNFNDILIRSYIRDDIQYRTTNSRRRSPKPDSLASSTNMQQSNTQGYQ
jgi:hypothetical protein